MTNSVMEPIKERNAYPSKFVQNWLEKMLTAVAPRRNDTNQDMDT
jgi:hypothetical protein